MGKGRIGADGRNYLYLTYFIIVYNPLPTRLRFFFLSLNSESDLFSCLMLFLLYCFPNGLADQCDAASPPSLVSLCVTARSCLCGDLTSRLALLGGKMILLFDLDWVCVLQRGLMRTLWRFCLPFPFLLLARCAGAEVDESVHCAERILEALLFESMRCCPCHRFAFLVFVLMFLLL